jgi:hypothetical protein
MKNTDYVNGILYFNKQINLLDLQLNELDKRRETYPTNDKEMMSLGLDKGRSLMMLSKCYELTNMDSFAYLNEHVGICEYLHDTFLSGKRSDKNLAYLYDQIFNDYDLSLSKLSKYFENVMHSNLKSIDMNKRRLLVLKNYKEYLHSTNDSSDEKINLTLLNTEIEINLLIAKLYFNESFVYRSLDYSKLALDLCTNLDYTFCINKYLHIKCLNLNCKLLFETINENVNSLSFKGKCAPQWELTQFGGT